MVRVLSSRTPGRTAFEPESVGLSLVGETSKDFDPIAKPPLESETTKLRETAPLKSGSGVNVKSPFESGAVEIVPEETEIFAIERVSPSASEKSLRSED